MHIFCTILCQNIIQQFGFIPSSIPDHSIIPWDISADYETRPRNKSPIATYDKFDTQSIPEGFLMSAGCLAQINQIIWELGGSFRAQSDVDSAYKNLCSVIKDEMSEKLAHRKIKNT